MLIDYKYDFSFEITEKFNIKLDEVRKEYQAEMLSLNERINPIVKRLEEALTNNHALRFSNDELFLKLYEGLSLPDDKLISHLKSVLFEHTDNDR